jgi:hypothetical protein
MKPSMRTVVFLPAARLVFGVTPGQTRPGLEKWMPEC